MRTEKLSDAKNSLSKLIEEVRRGERIRILVRGKPVADLVPIDDASTPGETLEEGLAQLARRGWIRRGSGKLDPCLLKPGPRIEGETVSSALLSERKEGR